MYSFEVAMNIVIEANNVNIFFLEIWAGFSDK